MLGSPRFLILLVVSATAFSGCLSGDDAPAPIEDQDTNDTAADGVITAEENTTAPDGRGEISAFKETNKTEMGTGGMEHQHDYWGGKERLDNIAWIDAGLIPIPFLPCKQSGTCTVGGGGETYPAGTAIADFDLAPPPEMGMIYEGTKYIELNLVEYSGLFGEPANPAGKVYFDYLAANDEPGEFRTGGELKLNEPFLIEIQPTDADMPHQTKSLWVFRIYSNSEMVQFAFNITISLVKGYEVVNWPPHPDLYADSPTRTVFEGSVQLESKGTVDAFVYGTDAGWTNPERVISWGTQRLDIEVTNVQFTGQVPVEPTGFVFEYHNASKPPLLGNGEAFGDRLTDPSSDGSTYRFTIDLTQDRGDAMDTPYAQYSRWGFRLVPYFEDQSGGCVDEHFWPGILFGCQWYPWQMSYDMRIVATGVSTGGEAMH